MCRVRVPVGWEYENVGELERESRCTEIEKSWPKAEKRWETNETRVCVSGREREKERPVNVQNTYCWLCWWQWNCLPFLRPGWQCWSHWPSVGPGRRGPLWEMKGTNCPWRHHHETEQHPLLSPNKEIPLDRDTGKVGNSQWLGERREMRPHKYSRGVGCVKNQMNMLAAVRFIQLTDM